MGVESSKLPYHTRPSGIYPAPIWPVGISPTNTLRYKLNIKKKKTIDGGSVCENIRLAQGGPMEKKKKQKQGISNQRHFGKLPHISF